MAQLLSAMVVERGRQELSTEVEEVVLVEESRRLEDGLWRGYGSESRWAWESEGDGWNMVISEWRAVWRR